MAGNEPGEMDIPQHDWEEVELDEATQKLIEKQTGHILNELADQVKKSRGTIPGEFQSILDKINHTEPPKFDWKGFLRRFSGASVKVYTKKSRRKLSKRYEENPGLKIKQKKHVLVAVDTSGSVSNNELIEFFQEINHIHKTGTDITVVQADTNIKDISPFDPKKEIKIHGRGGTSFDPVVEYYSENVHKYTCLIYLTDGEAPAPEYSRGRMLWVHSSNSSINESLPGIKIQLN
jgi:predicted metal-dependent peptidase